MSIIGRITIVAIIMALPASISPQVTTLAVRAVNKLQVARPKPDYRTVGQGPGSPGRQRPGHDSRQERPAGNCCGQAVDIRTAITLPTC